MSGSLLVAGCVANPSLMGDAKTGDGYRGDEQVAVLLPQSGRYAGAAQALRDGILAAQGADPQGRRPRFRFYDSSDPASAPNLLLQAAANGATMAIGPLQKEAVTALVASGEVPIPTLALNRAATEAAPPTDLYQFALSPEDEAADAASKAWANGQRSALLLYPEGRWGDRMAFGFRQAWLALGGELIGSVIYDPGASDFSAPVAELFARGGEATSTRFLFLVATAGIARQIWPRVQEYGGGGLSVYSTSHVYAGGGEADRITGLGGLYFVDIPWLLAPEPGDPLSRERLQSSLSGVDNRYIRLYAMGIDAYALTPRLDWMSQRPGAYLEGKTGRLTLDHKGRVRRELILAVHGGTGPVRLAQRASPATSVLSARPGAKVTPRLVAAKETGGIVRARP
jgi:outer membrane PBP1 activator LpoA protein